MSIGELTIRPVELSDSRILWEWANDRSVRGLSFNKAPISWESHSKWFQNKLSSNNTRFYILLKDQVAVGQIRYDKDDDSEVAEISFSIADGFRGLGLGSSMLQMTLNRACDELAVAAIRALVIDGNVGSKKAFFKCGFKVCRSTKINGLSADELMWRPYEQ